MSATLKSAGSRKGGIKPAKALKTTLYDYASATTAHGISYVFDRSIFIAERLLWFVVTALFVALAIYWSVDVYKTWKENPVLTSVKTTGLPLSKIKYPAITICSQGLIQSVIDQALTKQKNDFIRSKGKDPDALSDEELKAFENQLQEERYPGAITSPTKMVNVLTSENPSETLEAQYITDPKAACVDVGTDCKDPWVAPSKTEAYFKDDIPGCFANLGAGMATEYRCGAEGGTKWTFTKGGTELSYLKYTVSPEGEFSNVNTSKFWMDGYVTNGQAYNSMGESMTDIPLPPSGTFNISTFDEKNACIRTFIDVNTTNWGYDVVSCSDAKDAPTLFLCFRAAKNCSAENQGTARRRRNVEASLDKVFEPSKKLAAENAAKASRKVYSENFRAMDPKKSYKSLFEILWYTQLPCFEVEGVTAIEDNQNALIKSCIWKGIKMPCSKIFTTYPTDQGMCCTFNMDKAESMFKESAYQEMIMMMQTRDKNLSYDRDAKTAYDWDTSGEPTPQSGRSKGLTLLLDAHSDLVSGGTVAEDFDGFYAIIDASDHYPTTTRKSVLLRPGHNNIVSMSASKVTASRDIEDVEPEKRYCLFDNEHKIKELKMHKKYRQANCMLECSMDYAQKQMNTSDPCIPWYFPVTDDSTGRMCDPWEAREFRQHMKNVPDGECEDCLPDCSSTLYTSMVTAAPFRRCDYKNLGISTLCTFEIEDIAQPPIWGQNVLEQYLKDTFTEAPARVKDLFQTNQRKYVDSRASGAEVFSAVNNDETGNSLTYDAYKRDIAMVTFFFETTTVFEYSRVLSMTPIQYVSQLGGLLGLCIGFSFISAVEIAYWFTIRFMKNMR